MVRDTENPSFREASCCSVEVVNGAAGLRWVGLRSTRLAVSGAPWAACKTSVATSGVSRRLFNSALKPFSSADIFAETR